ncbi:MAG: type II 3-dehydroquinate dehydratase [Chloroflexi bacterium]|nr:type II 3-dehydroquinate dehydratase [Chloroflexota bacterium]
MKFLVINGPNLNLVGIRRHAETFGRKTLEDISSALEKRAAELGVELSFFQSNSEGRLIDFIQANSPEASGVIINPSGLTHSGFSLRAALIDAGIPVIEVHITNIYREDRPVKSIIAPVAKGHISGMGWRGYLLALEALAADLSDESKKQ